MSHIFRGLSFQYAAQTLGDVKPMAQDALNLLSWLVRHEFDLFLPSNFFQAHCMNREHGTDLISLSAQRENEDFSAGTYLDFDSI